MLVKGEDKTFPERITTKKQRSPMVELSGIFKGWIYCCFLCIDSRSLCRGSYLMLWLLDGGINRLNNTHI